MSRGKTVKKIAELVIRYLLMLIIGVSIGSMVYTWNAKSVLGDMLPMPFGYGVSVVLTGSMEPVLSPDDFLIIKKQDYKSGDIIVYQENKSLIVHRLMEVREEDVITKGDANNVADSPVLKEQIKGVVIKSIPGLGKAVDIIQGPIGVLLCAGCLFLMFKPGKKEKDEEKEKQELAKEIELLKLEAEITKEKEGKSNAVTIENAEEENGHRD